MKSTRLLFFSILAVSVLIVFAVALQQYVSRTSAATSEASVAFVPQSDGRFAIVVNASKDGDKISVMDLHVTAENGTVAKWDGCASPDNENLPFSELISKPGAGARYSCSVIKDKDQLPKSIILSGSVACDGTKPVRLTVEQKSTVGGPIEGVLYSNKIGAPIDVTCGDGEPEGNEDVITRLEPIKSCDIQIGEVCYLGIESKAQKAKKISAVYMKLEYDPQILEFQLLAAAGVAAEKVPASVLGARAARILAQAGTPGPNLTGNPTLTLAPTVTVTTTPTSSLTPTTSPSLTLTPTASPTATLTPTTTPKPKDSCTFVYSIDPKEGTLEYMYACNKPKEDLMDTLLQALEMKGIGAGKGTFKMLAVQAVGPATSGTAPAVYTVKKSTADYSVGGSKANVKLDLKVRLQCVVKKPKGAQKLNIRVGIGDGKLKQPIFQTGEFTVDDKGFWNGSVAFNVPAGQQYKLLVKGDKHMQKKICEASPREDYPGAYSCDKGKISLKEGTQTIDLTKVIMLTGDLPPGEQDGISNAKDQSLVRNLIGKNDEASAKLADINFDGVVNAVDHSCMIAALSVRWDEE